MVYININENALCDMDEVFDELERVYIKLIGVL